MEDTDFDLLCEGASPPEAKRLRKLLAEWCDGDENSFPVQMALLSKAQWRAAAHIPRLVNESSKLLDLKLAESRRQTASLVESFAQAAETKERALQSIIVNHNEATKKTLAEMRTQLTNAEFVAERIGGELKNGAFGWKAAAADFQAERTKLEEARHQLDARLNSGERLCFVLLLVGLVGVGVAIGLWIAR
jgi:hypothetical protein